ncbi:hypothetical protein [Mycolicibacterium fluoranthenivorans]|uniref:Uncharacterized protein n=1 Tax=Mycolicibacterium fluoranthenivorans TaxID=258505 RepID=A0A7X5TWN7_9MYCO|nr:hypothetical protein [Mycolicibacterium fluoranthenivorans]MCV7356712.1 hypothetical protein [Mycolicibacterium fluoranthenivorans]NIH94104.1 hypothetical protein [Mycolicibacterium fluoranthenivorans]
MRFLLAALLWLITTALLVVTVPALWAQHTIVDRDGYTAFAAAAAKDPALQQAMASELGSQLKNLASGTGYDVGTDVLSRGAGIYTASSAFPGQFAQVNGLAHDWLFTDRVSRSDATGRWVVDISPMLADSSFRETLTSFGIAPPSKLEVPLTEQVSEHLRPGQLRLVAVWGPWASVGAAVLTGVFALLTLAAARARGKAFAALGISALLVGAAGWVGIEIGRRYVDDALNHTSGDVHAIADVMVDHAVGSMHMWLNLTLTVGGGLVIIGVIVALLSGLGSRRDEV